MTTFTVTLCDSSTLCPVKHERHLIKGIESGATIRVLKEDGAEWTGRVNNNLGWSLSLVDKSFHRFMKGCEKAAPETVEVTVEE